MNTITLRVPDAWVGRLDSPSVRQWLGAYLQRPTPNLPADPGGGEARVTLCLPRRAVRVVSGLLDETESGALRRIIAANIGGLPATRPRYALPASTRCASPGPSIDALPLVPSRVELEETVFDGWHGVKVIGSDPPSPASLVEEPELSWLGALREMAAIFLPLVVIAGVVYLLHLVFSGSAQKALPAAAASPPQFKPWVSK
jgi:hypothetical protein